MRHTKAVLLPGLCSLLGAQAVPTPKPKPAWAPSNFVSDEQRTAISRRLFEKEPFLKSYEAMKYPGSLGLFLRVEEYDHMAGNPGTGYLDSDPSFSWPWKDREVSISFRSASAESRDRKSTR